MLKDFNLYAKISLFLIFVLPWLTIFQGFHHIDEGFIITNSYFFFSHPESIHYGFTHYLTDLFGWISNQIFEGFGLISFRIGYILILYATYLGSYLLLKDVLKKEVIFMGLLFAYLFTNNVDAINWVNYYPVTTLFYIWSLYFFWKGLSQENTIKILLSGIILGIGVYARLPNIVSIALIGVIPLYFILKNHLQKEKGIIWKYVLYFLIGYCVGMGAILYFAWKIGHLDYLSEAVGVILGMASEGAETKNHGITYLLSVYGKSFGFVMAISICVSIGAYLYYRISNIFRKNILYYYPILAGILFGIISVLKFYKEYNLFGHSILVSYVSFIFPFISLYILLLLILRESKGKLTFFFLLGIFLMIFIPLGGGGYLEMMQNAGFILFPLIIGYLSANNEMEEKNNTSFFRYILPKVLLIIIVISSVISTFHIIWHNNSPFTYLHSGKLKLINIDDTTLIELQQIESDIIEKYPNQKWLFLSNFGYASYLYYLYDILPYLGNSVPAYYPIETYKKKLIENLYKGEFPIIVIDKFHHIAQENSYRKHGENMEKITFEILGNKNIMTKKILETDNFIFYQTQP